MRELAREHTHLASLNCGLVSLSGPRAAVPAPNSLARHGTGISKTSGQRSTARFEATETTSGIARIHHAGRHVTHTAHTSSPAIEVHRGARQGPIPLELGLSVLATRRHIDRISVHGHRGFLLVLK